MNMNVFGETVDFAAEELIVNNTGIIVDEMVIKLKEQFPNVDETAIRKTIWARMDSTSEDTLDGTIVSLYLMSALNTKYADLASLINQSTLKRFSPEELSQIFKHHSDTFYESNGQVTEVSDEELAILLDTDIKAYVVLNGSKYYTLGYYTINGCHKINTAIIAGRSLDVKVIDGSSLQIKTDSHRKNLALNSGNSINKCKISTLQAEITNLVDKLAIKNTELFNGEQSAPPNDELVTEITNITNEITSLSNILTELQKE